MGHELASEAAVQVRFKRGDLRWAEEGRGRWRDDACEHATVEMWGTDYCIAWDMGSLPWGHYRSEGGDGAGFLLISGAVSERLRKR